MQANFLDMYHGDNNEMLPDFAKLKSEGIILIALKATQGSNYKDPTFLARAVAADKAGLPVIAYHFGDGSTVAAQVNNFANMCNGTEQHMTGKLWPCLDFEQNKLQMPVSCAVAFLKYFPPSAILYGSDLVRENAKAFAGVMPWLWLAEYGPRENIPAPWTTATTIGWQYSESGSIGGIKGHVDLNVTPFTVNQLASIWGKPCSTAS